MGALSDHSCTKGGPQSNHQIQGGNGQLDCAAESRIPMLPGYEKLHNPESRAYVNAGYCSSCNREPKNLCARHRWKYIIMSICTMVGAGVTIVVVRFLCAPTGLSSGPQDGTHQDFIMAVPSTTPHNLQPASPGGKWHWISNKTDTWLGAYNHCIALDGRLLALKDAGDRNIYKNVAQTRISKEDRIWVECIVSQKRQIHPVDPEFREALSKVNQFDDSVVCGVVIRDQNQVGSMKLMGRRVGSDKRKDFFTQRVISLWNMLPEEVVTATSLDGFKEGLDKFMENRCINGY